MVKRGDIGPTRILSIYRTMLRTPEKTFIQRDFGGPRSKQYLDCLTKLKVLEKVRVVYPNRKAPHNNIGYRLKRDTFFEEGFTYD